MLDRLLDEAWADRAIRRVLWWHISELCLTANGYEIIVQHGINLNGGYEMPLPEVYKGDDGVVREVIESKTLTLDEIDARIIEAQNHVQELQDLRSHVDVLVNGVAAPVVTDPGTPVTDASSDQPVVDPTAPQPGVDVTVTPSANAGLPAANTDNVQIPATPADAPEADTSAFNNGQADPAAASNPQPPVVDAAAPVADPGTPDANFQQPVVSA